MNGIGHGQSVPSLLRKRKIKFISRLRSLTKCPEDPYAGRGAATPLRTRILNCASTPSLIVKRGLNCGRKGLAEKT